MTVFLFVSAIYIGETSVHQPVGPHGARYWSALPWILLGTIIIKLWLAQFVRFLADTVRSETIYANATRHIIEAVMTFFVICGLIIGHSYHFPAIDGYIGIVVSAWLLYLGHTHARHSIIPILGRAPSHEILQRIPLHAGIPDKYGPARMHEIAEACEDRLRKTLVGESVCNTDPLIEKTAVTDAIEKKFVGIAADFPNLKSYHRFRVIGESPKRKIIAADINLDDNVPGSDYADIAKELEREVVRKIPNIAYRVFSITPKFAY